MKDREGERGERERERERERQGERGSAYCAVFVPDTPTCAVSNRDVKKGWSLFCCCALKYRNQPVVGKGSVGQGCNGFPGSVAAQSSDRSVCARPYLRIHPLLHSVQRETTSSDLL